MKNLTNIINSAGKTAFLYAAPAIILFLSLQAVLLPNMVNAAQLSSRKLTLSSSASGAITAGQDTTWTVTFDAPATTALNGVALQICDAASGTCNTPGSWANTGSAFGSLTYNGSNQTGWTLDNTAGFLRVKNNSSATATANPVVLTFNTVDNPQNTNTAFFARITTYTGDDFTGELDSGVVAASTATQINLSGTMDESLVFCTGTSITGQNCGSVAGSSVSFGSFSSSTTSTGTSVMAASTNGIAGYAITINGSTLTCAACAGTPTIAALASQTASSTNSAQFGVNLKDNATPNVGAEVSGPGSGAASANYGTADQYRFVTGDGVAAAATATDADTYTVSYIANVPGSQAAGTYTAIMTFIATATF